MNLKTLNVLLDDLNAATSSLLADDKELRERAEMEFEKMRRETVDPVGVYALKGSLAMIRSVVLKKPTGADLYDEKMVFLATAREMALIFSSFEEFFTWKK